MFYLFLVVCETPDIAAKTFVSGLDGSGWLKHIKAILDTSIFIAKVVAVCFCICQWLTFGILFVIDLP